jgi:DNA (cytosine-5)-methyltransferase 1
MRTGPDSRVAFITNNNTNRKATSANDPVPTMTTGNQQIVTQAAMRALHIGQENFDDAGHDPAEPFSTMTLSPHHSVVTTGLVAGHMAQQNADNVGHPMDEPMSTMTTKVCHQNFVASHLMTLRQNTFGQSVDEPMSALCAAGNHHAEVRTSLVKYYGGEGEAATGGTTMARSGFSVVHVPVEDLGLTEEQRYEAWWTARFLEIYGTKDQGNPNTAHLDGPRPSVIGRPGAILWTIEMRMLVPKEAFSASSFPKGYNFETRADGKKVSKTSQMALVGNAVPPGLAKAIVGANCKPRPSVSERMRLAA